MLIPPDWLSEGYCSWLDRLDTVVRDPSRFAVGRSDCDLRGDSELVGDVFIHTTSQIYIRTAVWQLQAAQQLHYVGAPPSAVPVLVRAALETSGAIAWVLAPEDSFERVERYLRLALQDSYDQSQFEGSVGAVRSDERRSKLLEAGQRLGRNERYFQRHRFSISEALRDLQDHTADHDLGSFWSLLSGLSHGRRWAIHAAAVDPPMGTNSKYLQLSVPREQFGFYQLRTAEILDTAVGLWNQRVGSVGTAVAVPRVPRGANGRVDGLSSPPWSWSQSVRPTSRPEQR